MLGEEKVRVKKRRYRAREARGRKWTREVERQVEEVKAEKDTEETEQKGGTAREGKRREKI